MNRNATYIIAAGSGLLLVGWIGTKAHQANRNKRAGRFLAALQAAIQPDSKNSGSHDFFDVGFAQRVQDTYQYRVIQLQLHEVERVAKAIHNAWGTFSHETGKIYAELAALKDHFAGSQVAAKYQHDYGTSLLLDLEKNLTPEGMNKVWEILKPKVAYRLID